MWWFVDRDSEWQTEDWYTLGSVGSKKRKPKGTGEVQMRLSWVPRQKSKEELRIDAEREFFAAVAADDPHALRLLLARGVNPHCRNSMGMTAIELATERRKRKALSYLQKQIAAPDLPEAAGAASFSLNVQPSGSLPPVVPLTGPSMAQPGGANGRADTTADANTGTQRAPVDALPRLQ